MRAMQTLYRAAERRGNRQARGVGEHGDSAPARLWAPISSDTGIGQNDIFGGGGGEGEGGGDGCGTLCFTYRSHEAVGGAEGLWESETPTSHLNPPSDLGRYRRSHLLAIHGY